MNTYMHANRQAIAESRVDHYWSADQLRVMRGLEIAAWFRPFMIEPTAVATTAIPASIPAPVMAAAVSIDTVRAQITTNQSAFTPMVSEGFNVPQAQNHIAFLVVATTPLSVGAQTLWSNMLTSVGVTTEQMCVIVLPNQVGLDKDPFSQSAQEAVSHMQAQVLSLRPSTVLTLGELAAQVILGVQNDLVDMQGEVHDFDGLPLIVLEHPELLLKSPLLKAQVWRDLNLISH